MIEPLVTVGIPTYNRPDLLKRALSAVAKQEYPNLELLVSDNATPGDGVRQVVASYSEIIPRLTYVKHPHNIGSLENFLFLLAAAKGEYFMWLADDDEISANYIAALVELLEADPTAAASAGRWVRMESEISGRVMPAAGYRQTSALARALRFIWQSDDAFFYGVHRTNVIRKAAFRGYGWPNRKVLHNWAYVYLLDVVLRGRVLISADSSVQFINHDYSTKSYLDSSSRHVVARAFRRVNVHFLYWEKCARLLNPVAMPLVVATSLGSLSREGIATSSRRLARFLRKQPRLP